MGFKLFRSRENGFISAYRQQPNDDYFDIIVEYQAIADFNGSIYFVDPMFATGQSIVAVLIN
jgi:uracil phosphoribosyltransferase